MRTFRNQLSATLDHLAHTMNFFMDILVSLLFVSLFLIGVGGPLMIISLVTGIGQ
jgi:hypothetical protein